jgi:hypothetical protein
MGQLCDGYNGGGLKKMSLSQIAVFFGATGFFQKDS